MKKLIVPLLAVCLLTGMPTAVMATSANSSITATILENSSSENSSSSDSNQQESQESEAKPVESEKLVDKGTKPTNTVKQSDKNDDGKYIKTDSLPSYSLAVIGFILIVGLGFISFYHGRKKDKE